MPVGSAYEHGGNLVRAAEIFQRKSSDFLDFSANINPLGIPAALQAMLVHQIGRLRDYPDPEYKALRQALSGYTGLPAENILPGNGAAEIIYLLFQVLKPAGVLIPVPTFAEYEKSALCAGATVYYHALAEENGFQLDPDRLTIEVARGIDCLMLCNPNNPTSTLLKEPALVSLIERAGRNHIMVIIDEAFIELTAGSSANSMAKWVATRDNLFIIRAFTKIFAVPGLRLGYGLGPRDLIEEMRARQPPWSVNALAAGAGEYLVQSGSYLQKTSTWLAAEKEWLAGQLRVMARLRVFPPETNFILVKLLEGAPSSTVLSRRMGEKGILIRDAANFRALNDRFFRVAVKDRASNRRLVEALAEELGRG